MSIYLPKSINFFKKISQIPLQKETYFLCMHLLAYKTKESKLNPI